MTTISVFQIFPSNCQTANVLGPKIFMQFIEALNLTHICQILGKNFHFEPKRGRRNVRTIFWFNALNLAFRTKFHQNRQTHSCQANRHFHRFWLLLYNEIIIGFKHFLYFILFYFICSTIIVMLFCYQTSAIRNERIFYSFLLSFSIEQQKANKVLFELEIMCSNQDSKSILSDIEWHMGRGVQRRCYTRWQAQSASSDNATAISCGFVIAHNVRQHSHKYTRTHTLRDVVLLNILHQIQTVTDGNFLKRCFTIEICNYSLAFCFPHAKPCHRGRCIERSVAAAYRSPPNRT